ncbi:hypothetical protein BDN71DRAFT_1427490 [Pleurotus eryngii]|uniref:Uncharacterized protein n=1 Tax=Pleurotus eryngii TaxID=5323 RepID=A0A9P6DK44_PLEER|nr:hypothetical protein BDN71DRAFT_1427490 [Pleurotus eryngii]
MNTPGASSEFTQSAELPPDHQSSLQTSRGLLNILAVRAPYQAQGRAFFMLTAERIITNKDFARAERPNTIYSNPESQPGPICCCQPTTTPDNTAHTLMSQSCVKSQLEAIAKRQCQARKPLAISAPDPRLYDIALQQGHYRPSTGPSTVTRPTAPRRYDDINHASTSNSTLDVLVIPGDINVPMHSFDNGLTPLPSEVTDVTDAGLVSIVSPASVMVPITIDPEVYDTEWYDEVKWQTLTQAQPDDGSHDDVDMEDDIIEPTGGKGKERDHGGSMEEEVGQSEEEYKPEEPQLVDDIQLQPFEDVQDKYDVSCAIAQLCDSMQGLMETIRVDRLLLCQQLNDSFQQAAELVQQHLPRQQDPGTDMGPQSRHKRGQPKVTTNPKHRSADSTFLAVRKFFVELVGGEEHLLQEHLFHIWLDTAQGHPLLQRHVPMLEQLGPEGMSNDESDVEGDHDEVRPHPHHPVYRVKSPCWRAAEVGEWLEVFDIVHLFEWCTKPDLRGQYPCLRTRIPHVVDDEAKPMQQLPVNTYDATWLESQINPNHKPRPLAHRYDFRHENGLFRSESIPSGYGLDGNYLWSNAVCTYNCHALLLDEPL